MNRSWLLYLKIPSSNTPSKWKTDSRYCFEVTVLFPVQFSNDDFPKIDYRTYLIQNITSYSTTICCFKVYPKLNCKSEKRNGGQKLSEKVWIWKSDHLSTHSPILRLGAAPLTIIYKNGSFLCQTKRKRRNMLQKTSHLACTRTLYSKPSKRRTGSFSSVRSGITSFSFQF
jgi:hypothetical protein